VRLEPSDRELLPADDAIYAGSRLAREVLATRARREARFYAAFLPRQTRGAHGRLRVPEIDDALLSALSEREWRSLPDLLRTPPSLARWPTSGLLAMLRGFGDLFMESRLRGWTRLPDAPVEHTTRAGRYRLAFRLTARGRHLLQEGIPGPSSLPRTQIGGYDVGKHQRWICEQGERSWRLRSA
jgi:hypothetical protein